MKLLNKINSVTLAASVFATTALPAFAGDLSVKTCPTDSNFASLCTDASSIGEVIGRIITVVLVIAVVLALAYLIWGGIKWITSGGDKSKVESARSTIIAAIIGLIVAFLAFFIINLVLNLLGVGQFDNINLPNILGN